MPKKPKNCCKCFPNIFCLQQNYLLSVCFLDSELVSQLWSTNLKWHAHGSQLLTRLDNLRSTPLTHIVYGNRVNLPYDQDEGGESSDISGFSLAFTCEIKSRVNLNLCIGIIHTVCITRLQITMVHYKLALWFPCKIMVVDYAPICYFRMKPRSCCYVVVSMWVLLNYFS